MIMNTKILKGLACGFAAAVLLAGCSGGESYADTNGNVGEVTLESGDTYAVITVKDFGAITCKLFPEAAPVGVKNFIDLANSGYYTNKEIHRVYADFMFQGGSANGDGMSTDDEPKFEVEYHPNMRHFYGALCYANAGGINGTQFYVVNNKNYSPMNADTLKSNLEQLNSLVEQANQLAAAATDENEKAYYQYYVSMYQSQVKTTEASIKALEDASEEVLKKYEQVGGTPSLDGGYTVFGQTVDGFDVIDKISAVKVEEQSNGEMSHPVDKIVIESVEIFTKE